MGRREQMAYFGAKGVIFLLGWISLAWVSWLFQSNNGLEPWVKQFFINPATYWSQYDIVQTLDPLLVSLLHLRVQCCAHSGWLQPWALAGVMPSFQWSHYGALLSVWSLLASSACLIAMLVAHCSLVSSLPRDCHLDYCIKNICSVWFGKSFVFSCLIQNLAHPCGLVLWNHRNRCVFMESSLILMDLCPPSGLRYICGVQLGLEELVFSSPSYQMSRWMSLC
jgi:hypothetical protein